MSSHARFSFSHGINTLRPRQNGRHFPDDIFKWIFLNEIVWISINISLKFVPRGPINNIPTLVQVMAWCRPGNKPLSGPMMVRLPTHICVTGPQWVNVLINYCSVTGNIDCCIEARHGGMNPRAQRFINTRQHKDNSSFFDGLKVIYCAWNLITVSLKTTD